MKTMIAMRVVGSFLVIIAYFVILHINVLAGVVLNLIADALSYSDQQVKKLEDFMKIVSMNDFLWKMK